MKFTNFPFYVFLPSQNVPQWLEHVKINSGSSGYKKPKIIFGAFTLCFKFRNKFFLWSPFAFGAPTIKIFTNEHSLTVTGGGDGVQISQSFFDMLRSMRETAKNAHN